MTEWNLFSSAVLVMTWLIAVLFILLLPDIHKSRSKVENVKIVDSYGIVENPRTEIIVEDENQCPSIVSLLGKYKEDSDETTYFSLVRELGIEQTSKLILQLEEQSVRSIFNAIPIGIVILNSDYTISISNHFIHQFTGYLVDEFRSLQFIDLVSEMHQKKFIECIHQIYEKKKSHITLEIQLQNKKMDFRWMQASLSLIDDSNNNKNGLLLLIEDRNLFKFNNEEKQTLSRKLLQKEKMDLANNFTHAFAHDFNNLLTIIK